jgi:hypothetical protein
MKIRQILAALIATVMIGAISGCGTSEEAAAELSRATEITEEFDTETAATTSATTEITAAITTVGTTTAPAETKITMPEDWEGMDFMTYINNIKKHNEVLDLPLVVKNKTFGDEIALLESSQYRSVNDDTLSFYDGNVFYLTDDNVLFGYGDNYNGQLGDGTGVNDSEDEGPIQIMSDVANVYQFDDTIHAIKIDGSFWSWGNNKNESLPGLRKIVYEPINPFGAEFKAVKTNYGGTVLTKSGELIVFRDDLKFMPKLTDSSNTVVYGVKDYTIVDQYNLYVLHGNGDLIHYYYDTSYYFRGYKYKIISTDVIDFTVDTVYKKDYCHFIKSDNTLWAVGENSSGTLGDGTKIDRDKPVKIADNVKKSFPVDSVSISFGSLVPAYLTLDNELWGWSDTKPTPVLMKENIADYYAKTHMYLYTDGTMKDSEDRTIETNVKLPTEEIVPWAN